MGDPATLLNFGGLGVLALVILYLLGSNRADRAQYRRDVAQAAADVKAADEREARAWELLDDARSARHKAEDRVAELEIKLRQVGGTP